MSASGEVPEVLRPIDCHTPLRPQPGGNWVGDCPLCGKAGHLYASPQSGKWDCKVCGESGNALTFLTKLHAQAAAETPRTALVELARERGIPASALRAVGAALRDGVWLIPSRAPSGVVHDLRRWTPRTGMRSTAGCKSQLGGAEELKDAKRTARVWLCEGEWDRAAMKWLLREAGRPGDPVVCVPGAGVFKPEWAELLRGRRVVSVYDADDAGDRGAARAHKALSGVAASLDHVQWPSSRPKGFDLRDFAREAIPRAGAEAALGELLGLTAPEPRHWGAEERAAARPSGEAPPSDEGLEPITLAELEATFQEHVLMSPDMVLGLRLAAAVALSTDIGSDPLWLYLVGPPGAGKTLLLATMAASSRCVFRSTVTPHCLVSGWRGEGEKDPSLVPKLTGKTLVAKDFTEVLALPSLAQDEIFGTLRGAYDGLVEKSFGNGVHRSYKGCWFSMLAGVTHAIHGHSKATLGERFLKFQLRDGGRAHADAVVMAAIGSVGDERALEAKLSEAMARFLRNRVDAATAPRLSREQSSRLVALVGLIAVLRAQVERDFRTYEMAYRPAPESGTRLAKQLAKLAMVLAAAKGEREVSESTFGEVRRVAMDTAYGFHLDVVETMMELGGTATKGEVSERTELPLSTLQRRFDDLIALRAVERTGNKKITAGRPADVYQVTRRVGDLWISTQSSKNGRPAPKRAKSARS